MRRPGQAGDDAATMPTMAAAGSDLGSAPTQASEASLPIAIGTAATVAPGDAPSPGTVTPLPVIARDTYEIIGEHGRGGLGRVLRARDRRTGRTVAIKEMLGDRTMAERRFRREAIVTANLQHPSIVPVYEVGQWPDGAPFYAMKLVEGRSLDRVIQSAETAVDRLALLPHMVAIADALAYAHERGYLHRDLKPANVLIGEFGETVVIDWGLAKQIDDPPDTIDDAAAPRDTISDDDLDDLPGVAQDATRAGALLGTPVFMAPEQAAGEKLDRRADVYALGAMLYQLLGGRVPYAHSTGATVIADVLRGPPKPLAQLAPRTPRELLAIVAKAMARDRDARYATAGELAAELRRFLTGQLVSAHEYTTWQRITRFGRRHRVILAAGAITTAVVAVVTTLSYQRVSRERDLARTQQRAAETARAAAQANLAELHLELGRRELFEGRPPRALPHLVESARLGGPELTAGLRFLAGRAAESLATARVSYWLDAPLADINHPDGRGEWLAATQQGTVIRLDAARGREITRAVSPGMVTDLDLDATGAAIITSGEVTVTWDARSGAERARVQRETPLIRAATARDGRRAYGELGGALELWAPGATAPSHRWTGHAVDLRDFHLTADGTRLITTDDSFTGVVWDAVTAKEIARFKGIAALSPDGTIFAHVPADGDATVRRVQDGAVLATLPGTPDQRDIYIGPGNVIITLARDSTIASWRADGSPIARYPGHVKTLMVVVSSSDDGRWLVTGDEQGIVRLFDLPSGQLHARFDQGRGTIFGVQVGSDGTWVSAVSQQEITTWDVPRPHPMIGLAGSTDEVRRLTYADGGATVLTAGRDGALTEWDTETGTRLRRVSQAHVGPITWVEVSERGDRIVTSGRDGVVTLWDRELKPVKRLVPPGDAAPGSLTSARFLGGDRLIVGRDAGTVEVWDLVTESIVCTTPTAPELMNTVMSPDGTWFGTYHQGGEGKRFSGTDCAAGAVYASGVLAATVMKITPDGARVVIGGFTPAGQPQTSGLQVFDATTGALIHALGKPGDGYVGGAISDDGTRVAGGATDGKVRVWSLADGALVRELPGGTALVAAVMFSPDGALIIAGDDDGIVRVWDVTTGDLVAADRVLAGGIYYARLRDGGAQLAVAGLALVPQLITLPRWAGTADELHALGRCHVPWRLDGSHLVEREVVAADCAARP